MQKFFKQLIFLLVLAIVFGIGVLIVTAVNNRGNAPVAFWKFNEGYGSTAYDAAGSNDGTITNAQWRNEPDCKSGKCLYFDGSGDYVDVGDQSSLDITGDMSIVVWAKFNTVSGNKRIISKYKSTSDKSYMLKLANDELAFEMSDDGGTTKTRTSTNANLQTNIWYHLALIYDASAGAATFYKDGIALSDDGTSLDNSIYSGVAKFQIGIFDGGDEYFHGYMDDIRIYDYARTAAQIRADYLAGAGGRGASVVQSSKFKVQSSSEGLVGYWKMDESSWTVDCATETVMDSSGAGNNSFACPNAGGLSPSSGKFGSAGLFDGTEDYIKIPDIDF